MEQLIEGVLAVCSGLTEDDRSGYIIDGLAEAVDGLAVGFHIQLLQVCREAGQSLGIRKNCCAEIAACISLIDADQGIQKGCVLPDIGILSQSVVARASDSAAPSMIAANTSGPNARDRTTAPTQEEEE